MAVKHESLSINPQWFDPDDEEEMKRFFREHLQDIFPVEEDLNGSLEDHTGEIQEDLVLRDLDCLLEDEHHSVMMTFDPYVTRTIFQLTELHVANMERLCRTSGPNHHMKQYLIFRCQGTFERIPVPSMFVMSMVSEDEELWNAFNFVFFDFSKMKKKLEPENPDLYS